MFKIVLQLGKDNFCGTDVKSLLDGQQDTNGLMSV